MLKRSRKLVTYGRSSGKQTSRDNTSRENDSIEYERPLSTTITGLKGDENGELHSQLRPTSLGDDGSDPRKLVISSCDDSRETKSTAKGTNIYDLPSSGDELRDDFCIKKRRKLTSSGCKPHSHCLPNPRSIPASAFGANNSNEAHLEYLPTDSGDAPDRSRSDNRLSFSKDVKRTKTSALTTVASTVHKRHQTPTTSNQWKGRDKCSCSEDHILARTLPSPSIERSLAAGGYGLHLRQSKPIEQHLESKSQHVKTTSPKDLRSSMNNLSNSKPALHFPTKNILGKSEKPIPSRNRLVDTLDVHDYFMKESPMDYTDGNRSKSSYSSDCSEVTSDGSFTRIRRTHNLFHSEACSAPENRDTAPLPPSKLGGSKITYARQRSFLSDSYMFGGVQGGPVDSHKHPQIEQSKPGGSIPGVLVSTDSNENNGSGFVRSIHELRQAGENARFRGTVDSLLEDIEDTSSPVSSRRSGFIQLCEKLADRQFTQRFLEGGFDRRLASCIASKLDAISAYLAVCAYGLIVSVGPLPSTVLTSFWPKILELSPQLLEMEDDIIVLARHRRFNLSKAGQEAIHFLCSRLRESTLAIDLLPSQFSPQFVALRCIQLTVCKCRERGDKIDRVPESLLVQLVTLLLQHSSKSRDASFTLNDYLVLELTLSILDAYTTFPGPLGDGLENAIKGLSRLGDFLSSLEGYDGSRSRRIQMSFIRLILNITNNNQSLCEEFATPELIEALVDIIQTNFKCVSEGSIGKKSDSLDIVILALGALINLTEESGKSRKLFLGSNTESGSSLDRFLHLFSTGLESVSEVRLH